MMLCMEVHTAFRDRFFLTRRIHRAAVLTLALMFAAALLLTKAVMIQSHPNIHLLVADYYIVTWVGMLAKFIGAFLTAALIVALVYVSYFRPSSISRTDAACPSESDSTDWFAAAYNVAVAALKAWVNNWRCSMSPASPVTTTTLPAPLACHNRAAMRERRSHRRAIHILTSRSAAKGDGHAAVALTYSLAAITA